jgi:SEC-C motif-containing protein
MGSPLPRNRKIGRNEPCWCNSGKKYKKCHLDRDRLPRKQPWEIAAEQRKHYSGEKYCLHPEASSTNCSGAIVKAHSLARRAALGSIAEAGHVYGPDYDFMSFVKNKGTVTFKSVGINEASTFTGFCAKHDDRTFAPIEKQALTATAEQCFLISYRAVCRELFQKRLHNSSVDRMRMLDQGRSVETQIGTLMGLAEIQHHKEHYDEILLRSAFDEYRRLIIHFSCAPDVLSTGSFAPEYDFLGNSLQRMIDPGLEHIAVSIVPAGPVGFVMLGWLKQSDHICIPFVQSLLSTPTNRLADAAARLVFEHIENTYLRSSWWEALPKNIRQALIRRANSGVHPHLPRRADCLTDDKLHCVEWAVTYVQAFFPSI